VFYNRVLSKVFRHKRSEVTGNGEEYIKRNLTITPHRIIWGDKNKKNEMGGACSTYGERRGSYRVLVGKSERTETFG
jgi:hypothetical protein